MLADDSWVDVAELKISDELTMAVGRVALSFAAFENAVAMFLIETNSTDKNLEGLSLDPLSTKLNKLQNAVKSTNLGHPVPVDRIRELAHIRNDLVHGIAFIVLWASRPSHELTIWNPGRKIARPVSSSELYKISDEVDQITQLLADHVSDIKNTPGSPK